jgi:leucyl aminopeptidase
MGGFCGVAQGSQEPPKMLVLEYAGAKTETMALVGKGVTFDSGGISIKPATNMREMKMDMAGAALVLAVFQIIAQLKPKARVLGIIPAVENLPSGQAYKPGDVLTFLNGRTAEVVSTDAEGRLILADALCLAQKMGAKKIIDFATLTGAVIVALGHTRAGVMTNAQRFVDNYLQAAAQSGERHWQLPMDEEYFESLKSDVADSLNNAEDRVAGTIAGGKFLEKFIEKGTDWIHCDIAGMAWMPKAQGYWDKNATGFGIRTVTELLGV